MTRVLFVASEAYPLVKTGGLADVAGCLPDILRQEGADVRLLLPAYADVLAALKERLLTWYMETCDVVPRDEDKR
jgi:starch synthase